MESLTPWICSGANVACAQKDGRRMVGGNASRRGRLWHVHEKVDGKDMGTGECRLRKKGSRTVSGHAGRRTRRVACAGNAGGQERYRHSMAPARTAGEEVWHVAGNEDQLQPGLLFNVSFCETVRFLFLQT